MTDLKNTWVLGEQYAHTDQNAVANAVNANTHTRPTSGLYASLPAPGNAGALYQCTDVGLLLIDNGTSWDLYGGPLNRFTTPPSTSLSYTTLGTASFAADKGGRLLSIPSAGGDNVRVEYQGLSPSSGYTATAFFESTFAGADYFIGGLVLLDTVSGRMVTFGPAFGTFAITGGYGLLVEKFNGATSANGVYASAAIPPSSLQTWMRIRDDGTNRICEYSWNGVDWRQLHTVGRTDFLTPNAIGWGADNTSGTTAKLRLRSFAITSP